jgi:hypothetical protein
LRPVPREHGKVGLALESIPLFAGSVSPLCHFLSLARESKSVGGYGSQILTTHRGGAVISDASWEARHFFRLSERNESELAGFIFAELAGFIFASCKQLAIY